jgi:iron-sulfur cluster repair protein YtfE (RIC family)
MTSLDATPETAIGRAMFDELLYIHGAIRADLATVERLAGEVAAGLPASEVRSEIDSLQTRSPVWQLKVNCRMYCRFVHLHHRMEDTMFFPRLRETNPALSPVVDKLEADHRVVSALLDAVEHAASALSDDCDDTARSHLVGGLTALATHLLEHLQYEEREAGPTIRRMTGF